MSTTDEVATRHGAGGLGGEARLRAIAGTALLLIAVGTGILFADPLTVGALVALVARFSR